MTEPEIQEVLDWLGSPMCENKEEKTLEDIPELLRERVIWFSQGLAEDWLNERIDTGWDMPTCDIDGSDVVIHDGQILVGVGPKLEEAIDCLHDAMEKKPNYNGLGLTYDKETGKWSYDSSEAYWQYRDTK